MAQNTSSAVRVEQGDCLDVMRRLLHEGVRVDSIVTDPPYHFGSIVERWSKSGGSDRAESSTGVYNRHAKGFMGKEWDGGDIAFQVRTWQLAMMLLKPGGHIVAFGGTKGFHRLTCAIEDAGAEVRDMVAWIYGQGFPKSHNQGKPERIDENDPPLPALIKTKRDEKWRGWGTALKPAIEPITVQQRPFERSVEANLAKHGVGAINIDGCRVFAPGEEPFEREGEESQDRRYDDKGPVNIAAKPGRRYRVKRLAPGATVEKTGAWKSPDVVYEGELKPGRWPANVVHDGSDEVLQTFALYGDDKGAAAPVGRRSADKFRATYGAFKGDEENGESFYGDTGTAARFFYCAKATESERVYRCTTCDRHGMGKPDCGCVDDKGRPTLTSHPTVKPIALMRWLCRLVTPPGGLILDPFAGTGTTGAAALAEGFGAVLIEREAEYAADIDVRLNAIPTVARDQGGA